MEYAKIRVYKNCADVEWMCPVPSGTVGGTITVEYVDPMWEGLQKTAVFRGADTKDVINVGTEIPIPCEVVARPGGMLRFGLYGVNPKTGHVTPTFWAELSRIRPGAEPSGDHTTDPTLPVWAQIMTLIGDLDNLTTESRENLVAAINEALSKSADEEAVLRIVTDYLEENPPAPGKDGQDGRDGEDGKSAYEYAKAGGYPGTEEEFEAKLASTPDLNASEGEPGYIANRTHYKEVVELFPETVLSNPQDGVFVGTCDFAFEDGKTYTIKWNGTSYEVTAIWDDNLTLTYVGNTAVFGFGESTGEPFFISCSALMLAAVPYGEVLETVTLSITGERVVQIPSEYIPPMPGVNAIIYVGLGDIYNEETTIEDFAYDEIAKAWFSGGVVRIKITLNDDLTYLNPFAISYIEGTGLKVFYWLDGKEHVLTMTATDGTWTPPTT